MKNQKQQGWADPPIVTSIEERGAQGLSQFDRGGILAFNGEA